MDISSHLLNWPAVIIAAVGIIAILAWCRSADRNAADRGHRDGSESLVFITRRLVWKHFKLALCIVGSFFVVMWLFATMSKKRPNAPQALLQSIVGPIAAIVLGFLIFASYIYDEHRMVFNIGLAALYLIWLLWITYAIVDEEYNYKAGTKILREPTKEDVWGRDGDFPILQNHVPDEIRKSVEKGMEGEKYAVRLATERHLYESFYKDLADGLYDTGKHSRKWEFPEEYTNRELRPFRLKAMLPWVLMAALVMVLIPWRGAADAPCYNGCTAAESSATPSVDEDANEQAPPPLPAEAAPTATDEEAAAAKSTTPASTDDDANDQPQQPPPLPVEATPMTNEGTPAAKSTATPSVDDDANEQPPLPAEPSSLSQPKESAESDIRSLLSTWTESFKEKDVERQMDCYAPVMDTYFLQHNVSRDFVQADKSRAFDSITDIRTFEISDITIEFASSSNATVTFRKKWNTRLASGKPFWGEEIEQLQVANLDDGWKIASEKEVQIVKVEGKN